MKWGKWSTTAASNSSTPPDGWPEGQLPSTVNDCAREMMAAIRTGISDIQFVDQDHSVVQTGSNTFTVPGNVTSYYDYGRRVKLMDGSSTKYGTVYSSSFTTNTGVSVRLDPGTIALTTSLSAVGVGAAGMGGGIPFYAIQRNGFINGHLDIWQRGNTNNSISAGTLLRFTADRFKVVINNTSGVINAGRAELSANASNVPTVAQAGMLLNSSIGISVGTADTNVSGTDTVSLRYDMEGYDWRMYAQKPLTISFFVQSNVTGTYCLSIGNGVDRSIVMEYSVSAASVWEFKSITFPKSPSGGTWDYSNGQALIVAWSVMGGSTLQGGAGNWTATSILCTSNQVNFMASAGNTIRFAGFRLNEGTSPLPLPKLEYADELLRCKRYYRVINSNVQILGTVANSNTLFVQQQLVPPMRDGVAPSVSVNASMFVASWAGTGLSLSSIAVQFMDPDVFGAQVKVVGTPMTGGDSGYIQLSGSNTLKLDSEFF